MLMVFFFHRLSSTSMIAIFQGTNRWVGGEERPPWCWWWWVAEHVISGYGKEKKVRGTEGEQRREKRKRDGERVNVSQRGERSGNKRD